MIINTIYLGDCLDTLRAFPDCCIDCCVTSPPYYALRDYGVDNQIGLEDTPEQYIKSLSDVFDEVRRVLKPSGTLWLNIGDSYAGSMKGAAKFPDNAMNYKQGTNRGLLGKASVVNWEVTTSPKTSSAFPGCWPLRSARGDGSYGRTLFGTSPTRCQRA